MDLSATIYLTAAVMVAVLAGVVMVTRRALRRLPGAADPEALSALAAELKRANDLAETRIAALEARIQSLETRKP